MFPSLRLRKRNHQNIPQAVGKIGLTYTQYIVMMALWEFGDMSEKELGQKIYLDSGTLTPVLKKLEKACFVKRQRAKEDERFVKIILTESGIELKEKALQVPQALDGCIRLTYDEMITLRGLLKKALENVNYPENAKEKK